MNRGDIVTVDAAGDYGKPRLAVVVQSDRLTEAGLGSVVVSLITTHLASAAAFRLDLEPSPENGINHPSQIMADKPAAVSVNRIGRRIGRLDDETMVRLNRTLAFVIGLAD